MLRFVRKAPDSASGCFHDYLTGTVYTVRNSSLISLNPQGQEKIHHLPVFTHHSQISPTDLSMKAFGLEHRLMIVEGQGTLNTSGRLVSSSSNTPCMIRGKIKIQEKSCWQFYAPVSLYQIELGVCCLESNGKITEKVISFNSSTPRTVTLLADQGVIKTWVNHSAPAKKTEIKVDYMKESWYPYAKLSGEGVTIVYNPFATTPNTSISLLNPFNTHEYDQENEKIFQTKIQIKSIDQPQCEIENIIQLNKDKMLVISKNNRAKIIQRDCLSNKIEFGEIWIDEENFFANVFKPEEWAILAQYCSSNDIAFPTVQGVQNLNKNGAIHLEDLCSLLKFLVINLDRVDPAKKLCAQFQKVSEIVYQKLLPVIGPYMNLPNPIHSSLDQSTEIFFPSLISTQIRNKTAALNRAPWMKLQNSAKIVGVSENYLCCYEVCEKEGNKNVGAHGTIVIYLIGDGNLVEVFRQGLATSQEDPTSAVQLNFCGKKQQFDLESGKKEDFNLWKESNDGPHIYKILESCFNSNLKLSQEEGKKEFDIYEVKETYLRELIEDFKIDKELAISALEECGNVEDALIWISDPERISTRRKRVKYQKVENQQFALFSKHISMLELQKDNEVSRLVLQILNKIYILGVDSKTLTTKYLKKGEKGFMNLANFSYSLAVQDFDFSNIWFTENNHCRLSILDSVQIKNASKDDHALGLFFDSNQNIFYVYSDKEMPMKIKIKFSPTKVYSESSCLNVETEAEPFDSEQFVPLQSITRLISGEWFIAEGEQKEMKTQHQLSLIKDNLIYSSLKAADKDERTSYLDVYFESVPHETYEDLLKNDEFIPLIVENGPPGCNMNYPICSILYPRSSQPFLANYPFSLTFRHLHRKYYNVNKIVINRIGSARKNVNEIKEGYVYFSNIPSIANLPLNHENEALPSVSKKYKFTFLPDQNECCVQINEVHFWEFMIIEPLYTKIKKLPFQIGFVGAKGVSIDAEIYQNELKAKIEKGLSVFAGFSQTEKCHFEIERISNINSPVTKIELKIINKKESELASQFSIKSSLYNIIRYHDVLSKMHPSSIKDQQLIPAYELCESTPQKILKVILKPPYYEKNKPHMNRFLRELTKNESFNFGKFTEQEMRKFIDIWHINQDIDTKVYQSVLNKVINESKPGRKYLLDLWTDLGKGYVTISPKYLGNTILQICKQFQQNVIENIIVDFLTTIDKKISPDYESLKNLNVPFLLPQTEYFSSFYYEQLYEYHEKKNFSAINSLQQSQKNISEAFSRKINDSKCQDIYSQQTLVNSMQTAIIKQEYLRKIIVKVTDQKNSYNFKNLVLRFDKSELYSKAIVSIYCYPHNQQQKELLCREVIPEHQWIQITKNPYREEMTEMFKENTEWLNAYGFIFPERVSTSYFQIEIMFSTSGIIGEKREKQNLPSIQILPELYGKRIDGVLSPKQDLDNRYFIVEPEEKFFITKLPSHLTLSVQNNLSPENEVFYNKYLVNKNNNIEYNLYETSEDESELKDKNDLSLENQMIEFKEKLEVVISSDLPSTQKLQKLATFMPIYHHIMDKINDSKSTSPIRITHKPTLDYFYTGLLLILQAIVKKKLLLSDKICQMLVDKVISRNVGPLSLTAFFSIVHNPKALLDSMQYVSIFGIDEPLPAILQKTVITEEILKYYDFPQNCFDCFTDKQLKANRSIVDSLLNLLVSKPTADEGSIRRGLNLLKFGSSTEENYEKMKAFILKLKSEKSESILFIKTAKETNEAIVRYLIDIAQSNVRFEQFIRDFTEQLSEKEIQFLILYAYELLQKNTQENDKNITELLSLFISELFQSDKTNKQPSKNSIQIISVILSLKLPSNVKWEYLSQCLALFDSQGEGVDCQSVIFSELLSVDGLENAEQLTDLVQYHKDIINKAAVSKHHAQLFVNFLKNLLEIEKSLFLEVIFNLPKGLEELHCSSLDIIVKILEVFCNFGGAEGAKLLNYEENLWLAATAKIMRLTKPSIKSSLISTQQAQALVRWYLMNNSYEKSITNPVNRSQSVNNITFLGEEVLQILTESQGHDSPLVSRIVINRILQIFNEYKQKLKQDKCRLRSSKFEIMNRIKSGISKLLENSVSNEQLTRLFAGDASQKGILQSILDDLLMEAENQEKKKADCQMEINWEFMKQKQLTEEMQGFSQGTNGKQVNLNVKDWQSYKGGSKSFVCKIALSSKKLILKPKTGVNISKIAIGFLVQDTPEKNNVLPDFVQLYGSAMGGSSCQKLCDLLPLEDQNYQQFGVKVFGINFNTINRKYRNMENINHLEIRFHCHILPSCSDILENYQKTTKNSLVHISFLSIFGFDKQPILQPSYTQIYMKLLSFLGHSEFQPTIKALAEKCFVPEVRKKLIKVLSIKGSQNSKATVFSYNSDEYVNADDILVNLAKCGINVLEDLLDLPDQNSILIKKILKNHLTVQNIDLVLGSTLKENISQESVSSLIENIKVCSYKQMSASSSTHSKYSDYKIFKAKIQDQYRKSLQGNAQDNKNKKIYEKLISCILTTPNLFALPIKKITEGFLADGLYYLVATYVVYSQEILNWLLKDNKVEEICQHLLNLMNTFKEEQIHKTEIEQIVCLLCSLTVFKPIKEKILHNPEKPQLDRFPIKVFQLLESKDKLLEEYPVETLRYFINFFKNTCSDPEAPKHMNIKKNKETNCSEDFADKLIELMVRLPEVSSQYHHNFIHEFFFPLINAFEGIPVNFIWKETNKDHKNYLNKPTAILEKLPIRPNEKMIEFEKHYYKLEEENWNKIQLSAAVLTLDGKVISFKEDNASVWKNIRSQTSPYSMCKQKEWEIQENKNIHPVFCTQKPESTYKIYTKTTETTSSLVKLLTNQTLLRVHKPALFGKNYVSTLPFCISNFDYIYWLPLEITPRQFLKEINICGYKLSEQTLSMISLSFVKGSEVRNIDLDQTILSQLKKHDNLSLEAVLQIQIEAHELFKFATVENISKKYTFNSLEDKSSTFVPQQTIFKVFEGLSGLEKMIKVMISCVKNWGSSEQSKIWLQYLNQLESFSCFPVFSSIYMTKQQNVDLLFSILSGLPDKEDSKKWLDNQKKNVKNLYEIIKNVFEVEGEQAKIIRKYAVEKKFYETMLQRLHLISKEPKRQRVHAVEEEEEIQVPEMQKKNSEDEYKKEIKKKKGVGYGTDNSVNAKWDITGHQEAKKETSDQIHGLFRILQKFLDYPDFQLPQEFLESTFNSALLPILESSLRGGSLLEISKSAELFKGELKFIRILAKREQLIPCFMELPKDFQPRQSESIYNLLKTLEGTSKIFLSCLTGSASEKISEEIAKNIIETFNAVEESIAKYKSDHVDEENERKILDLPLAKKYPILMKDLRFDYVDMKDKNGKLKHHYSSSYQSNHTSPAAKTIRLAQQLADISHALPIDHTNAIYVRCDKQRVDFMQALIMGSNGTPYAHGAYLFDIHFEDSYPNNPPKVNLTTTGSGSIRFNPNLYACGKVCLSLLGTWRGSAMQNWDSKVSTLLQVLVSIQSIIMAEDVYFNQPGFEHQQGTVEGEKKNEAYSNIVRYGNIKFAMLENIKNPPKGFETIIQRHFYLKKDQILLECKKWLKYAQKREASYNGLVSDHNSNWSNTFKKKDEYKKMLEKAINQLEHELNNLPEPSSKDLKKPEKKKVESKPKKEKKIIQEEIIEEIDVTYDNKQLKSQTNYKEIDINDEKVKDRWSRYIGAMGIEAVSKQSKANILQFGLSSLGIEIAKNIVLSGCRKFTVCDEELATYNDLSGQFYLSEEDVGKNRVQACLYKLQELNNYVRVESAKVDLSKLEENDEKTCEFLKGFNVIISTCHTFSQLIKLNEFCRKNSIKFLSVKCLGPYGYVFNDFGEDFEVSDKNGEQTVECMIENISNEEQGIVTLPQGQRHPYEDGQAVIITKIKGMMKKDGEQISETESINGTIHRITVINKNSFKIGNTKIFTNYQGNGLVRNIKLPIKIQFKNLETSLQEMNIDGNLEYYDFSKGINNKVLHNCFKAHSTFIEKHNKSPRPWNWEDSEKILEYYQAIKQIPEEETKLQQNEIKYVRRFSFSCSGNFAPLCAFYGGLVAQEAFKAITSKYMPVNQFFLTQFSEVVPEFPEKIEDLNQFIKKLNYESKENRFEGLRVVVLDELLKKIRECRVFVIGSGAIGCQLLKNYAMINLATSQDKAKGEIIVTDPDHIETSNLNRQFLFREKHIQKPKSATAAAAVKQMNKYLKEYNKIKVKLLKVCEATKDIFSNEFFETLDIVTNALDNVQARQYVDMRCVQNKVALLESGTLSSKGHVQVIVPYKTETYGSKADPAEDGEIPHCTLKMFPEQTLHCVEWARDIFGKNFTLKPKALQKLLQNIDEYQPASSEKQMLKDCLFMLQNKPNNFDDAIQAATQQFWRFYRNDIKQLLYTYPLDAKGKDGKDFWKLPKRPPTAVDKLDSQNPLHCQFITSFSVMLCKIFNIPYPKDFRNPDKQKEIAEQAKEIKVKEFVPSDKLAKQMAAQVEHNEQADEEEMIVEKDGEMIVEQEAEDIFKKIRVFVKEEKEMGNQLTVKPEQFEKDEDSNGHIDLIYSMANLRASNYKLDEMDWITTKLKAGRITPALSTTTSCIAGLQTIQLIKYLAGLPLDKMKNCFLNLAVPIIQSGEPGDVEVIKIHEELKTNIWERWSLEDVDSNIKMGELIQKTQEKYKISVKSLSVVAGGPIFSDLVLGLESKAEEKKKFMERGLKDVLGEEGSWQEGNFVDLALVMSVGEDFIKHVPTIRVSFKE